MHVCARIDGGGGSQMDDVQSICPSKILTQVAVVHHVEVDNFFCLTLVFALALDTASPDLLSHLLV